MFLASKTRSLKFLIICSLCFLLCCCGYVKRYEVDISSDGSKEVLVLGSSGPFWNQFQVFDRFLTRPGQPPQYLKGDSNVKKLKLPKLPVPIIP